MNAVLHSCFGLIALCVFDCSALLAQDGAREAMLNAFEEAQEASVLIIPFDPPLGTGLDYKLVVEKKRPRGDRVMEFEQKLTFTSLDERFALDLENIAFSISGQRVDLTGEGALEAMPMALRPFIMPLTLELDASGEAIELRDWPRIKGLLAAIPEEVRKRSVEADREAMEKAIDLVFGPLFDASPQEAPQLLAQGWTEVLGYGGSELEDGEVYEVENQIEGGLLPRLVPALSQVSVSRTAEGDYELVQKTIVDPEAFRVAMLEAVDQLKALAEDVRNFAAGQETEHGEQEVLEQVRLVDSQVILFDAQNGLPKEARIERTTHLNGEAVAGDIITIIRLGR